MLKVLLSTLIILSSQVFAATQDGVTLPDSMNIAGKNLVLNGMGTRKATFFKVKVYVGGLYLTKKSSDYNKFLKNDEPKHVSMKFVRSVGSDKMKGGWKEAFDNAFKERSGKLEIQRDINTLLSYMPDMEEGDTMSFTFLKDGVVSIVKGKKMAKINGRKFSEAMLSVWFINVGDKGLKQGFLGL
jgi:hypothetical protein